MVHATGEFSCRRYCRIETRVLFSGPDITAAEKTSLKKRAKTLKSLGSKLLDKGLIE